MFAQRAQVKFQIQFTATDQPNMYACRYRFNGFQFVVGLMMHKEKCYLAFWEETAGKLSEMLWSVQIQHQNGKFLLKDSLGDVMETSLSIDKVFESAMESLVLEIQWYESFSLSMF
jgi:hypothetical protein